MTRHNLDARRLLCPMPVIRVQDRVAGLAPGDLLDAICTDPGVKNDIPAWCRINGHRVVEIVERADQIVVTVEVGAADKDAVG